MKILAFVFLAALSVVIGWIVWRCFVTGEKYVDTFLLSQRNKRHTAARAGAALLVGLAIAFGAGMLSGTAQADPVFDREFRIALEEADAEFDAMIQLASSGRVSGKDFCHNSKSLGYKHWHFKKGGLGGVARKHGNRHVAGPCVDGVRLLNHGLCAEARVAFSKAKAARGAGRLTRRQYQFHAAALLRCIQRLPAQWPSLERKRG